MPNNVSLFTHRMHSTILSTDSGICGECGKPEFLFINRDGKTMCWLCDADKQENDNE
jgi:uncharacterized Zn finger protein (UPF0148 family)